MLVVTLREIQPTRFLGVPRWVWQFNSVVLQNITVKYFMKSLGEIQGCFAEEFAPLRGDEISP